MVKPVDGLTTQPLVEIVSCPKCGVENDLSIRSRCKSCATILESTRQKIPVEVAFEPKPETQEKEKKKMKTGTLNMAKGAVSEAAKFAAAKKANKTIVRAVTKALEKAGVPKEIIETPAGQKILSVVGPMMVHLAADNFPNVVPKTELVKAGCERALTVASVDVLESVLEPFIDAMVPALKELASDMSKVEGAGSSAEEGAGLSAVPDPAADAAAV